ncbi:hypothetical protein [Actinoplanes couchii]|uniref:Uncharacterized protein n=1 Tax=Actinoplanes couchii TaxID=403638 RepID=A0ABQ3XJC9_9ACTN|nr:hypothetical protein [Actinoplanes couchii]GID58606.1 hypothetical protein Aco03nite_070100 [Actinoplanes couchii]
MTAHDTLIWDAEPVTDDLRWRAPDLLRRIAAVSEGRTDQRFRLDHRNVGLASGWGISLLSDAMEPGVTLVIRSVRVAVRGRAELVRSLHALASLNGPGALIDMWNSYFNVFHRDYDCMIPRSAERPASPAHPSYWTMEPCWDTFDVPHRAARRLAGRAAEALRSAPHPGGDAAMRAEAAAWWAITPDVDAFDSRRRQPGVEHPAEVKNRLGLRAGLTAAQIAAAAWHLDTVAHGGLYDAFPGQLARDACQMAHPLRVRLLDEWRASGRRWEELKIPPIADGKGPCPKAASKPIWLAHDLTDRHARPWCAVLSQLRLSGTQARIASLMTLRSSDIPPVAASRWAQAMGQRLHTDERFWQDLVDPLAVRNVDPLDAGAWALRRPRSSLDFIASQLVRRAIEGWTSPEVRHIPWPVRDRYRALGAETGIGPGDAPRLYRILLDDPAGHDKSLALLKALNRTS